MCGRFGFAKPKETVKKRFNLKKLPDNLPLLYNIAPQQNIPTILNESPDELSMTRWGLVPHWSKEETFKLNLINAKAETIAEKPIFKGSLKSKRCLVLADGFYEWKKVEGKKAPYRIMMKDEDLFAFAGIWECWGEGDKQIKTCCIITTAANKLVADIHDRMPVILSKEDESKWLSDLSLDEAVGMLKPYDQDLMKAYPISTLVNSPSNNSALITDPIVM